MVEVKDLFKRFGKNEVLKGISLTIKKGKVTAILGPNGSGKTTLIKSILGLVIPTSGKILVNGKDIKGNYTYRKDIGYMPQLAVFPENLTVKELIRMLIDVRKDGYNPRIMENFVEGLGIEKYYDKKLKTLSGGTKQKINALIAFMFDPQIFILDEPTVGLDPVSSSFLKDRINEEVDKGKLVILTSHIMSEVEEVADELVFLLEGKVYVKGTVKEIIDMSGEKNLERAIAKLMEKGYDV
ncbi:MAG TPA: ABC transporter ATP-binding protein [Persephonella sp.]|uniref:Copper-transport ATP-binding protein NosF n=1 Tax=Persephonella marina (strain DSM 14350 / EX-H1) TaxID=123214 RepID=C0QQT8_PERMH|nr:MULTISPECIES: ABC transporter ATP-binding protein [Persephonella]ACO04347.1 copper-transport ATP-binding protein NosF [Persephonella marina EX-H1]HCB68784.1 ABC transporter ATP-binding protein [Persephonella sp.]